MSNEQKLREAVFTVLEGCTLNHDVRKILEAAYYAPEALTLPTDDVKSVLQDALNVLGCLEYGITGVDSWPCEDSVEAVVHRIRNVLEESQ